MNTSHASRSRRGWIGALAAVATLATFTTAPTAMAQPNWHSKPITYVVPYPPGGTVDVLGRLLTERLSKTLGVTVVVDNKPGATGTIGGGFVARAAPDGYTVLGTSIGPQAIAPHLLPKLGHDPVKSYEPVSLVGTAPHLLVVPAASKYTSVAELVAAGRAGGNGLAFASGGNGTILHMQGELLRMRTGVALTHVPYKGDIPALQDVIGAQVDFMFVPVAAALQQVQAGRLRALAVTSAKRLPQLAKVPTMAEAGVPDFVVEQWQAIYLPAGTPQAIVERLHTEVAAILKTPDMIAALDRLGIVPVGSTPQELARRQAEDSARWASVIRTANIKID